ncbi:Arogenate dehydratase 3, chloroplastic [Apostasia shenzhenica]|uniref:Arogenate dehydratase 3, chloroplastic n=1 Tax=Apostasia shenzhenica TaxID=1088818 RepID=A0A2H9ZV07_9ASPA|nr:Arogenate dehydratase 3, chloroplastic [Apostasia shenzhenica]
MAAVSHLKVPNTLPSSNRRTLGLPPSLRQRPSVVSTAGHATPNRRTDVNGVPASSSSREDLRIGDGPPIRVAFQGSHGAYSEFAAKTAIPDCTTVPCRSFSDAIAAVGRGGADRAVLPVESTMEGTALRNYDLILCHDLQICQEISLFVHYCLLAMPGVRTAELRRVISHPMALAHCGRALAQLGLRREPVEDTAGAVQMLLSRRLVDTAAIASPRAAAIYGLDVLADGLQDASWNVTRFLLLSKPNPAGESPAVPSAKLKTSMVVAHRGGSMMILLKVLSAFSSRNLNLTKLEVNNPSLEGEGPVLVLDLRGMGFLRSFPHVIYVDFEGSTQDPKVQEAMEEIARFSVFVRILGCYAADPDVYDLHH